MRATAGALVLTRDLQVPSVKHLALRPIATRRALGGDSGSPFVFKLKISPNRMGLDLGGRF
jgi:hypothetical protein